MAVPPEIVSKSTFTVLREGRESLTSNRRWLAFSAALASAIERAGVGSASFRLTVTCWPAVQLSGLGLMFHSSCPGVIVAESVLVVKVLLSSCKIVPLGSSGLITKLSSLVVTVFPGSMAILVCSIVETV